MIVLGGLTADEREPHGPVGLTGGRRQLVDEQFGLVDVWERIGTILEAWVTVVTLQRTRVPQVPIHDDGVGFFSLFGIYAVHHVFRDASAVSNATACRDVPADLAAAH